MASITAVYFLYPISMPSNKQHAVKPKKTPLSASMSSDVSGTGMHRMFTQFKETKFQINVRLIKLGETHSFFLLFFL